MKKRITSTVGLRQTRIAMTLALLSLVWIITAALSFSASAAEPDLGRKGSITMTIRSDGTAVPGGSFSVYRVADLVSESGYRFAYTTDFTAFSTAQLTSKYTDPDRAGYVAENVFPAERVDSSDNVDANREMAAALASYINNSASAIKPLGTLSLGTGGNNTTAGTGTFAGADNSGLSLGLYLFVQDDPAANYQPVSPFLVSVPRLVDGEYEYNVNAYPKPGAVKGIDSVTQVCPVIAKQVVTADADAALVTDLEEGTYFDFMFEALDEGAPMPVNAGGSVENGGPVVSTSAGALQLRIFGNGTIPVGTITFTAEGEYRYMVRELEGPDTTKYDYDTSVYWLKYTVTANEDHTALEVSDVQIRIGTDAASAVEGDTVFPADGVTQPEFAFTNKQYIEDPDGDKGESEPESEPESESESENESESETKGTLDGGGNSSGTNVPGGGNNTGGTPTSATPRTSTGSTLPQTGQLWWPVWLLIAAGAVLLLSGLLLKRHNRNNG